MGLLTQILLGLLALEHLYIMILEMFLWTTRGPKTFKSLSPELFPPTRALAANQGLYNGFLAAGLIWALLIPDPAWSFAVGVFFSACVVVAGVFGAFTAQRSILFVQALPGALTLGALLVQKALFS